MDGGGPRTWKELVERDVFRPLGMGSAGFEGGRYEEGVLAVSSVEPEAAVRPLLHLTLIYILYLTCGP